MVVFGLSKSLIQLGINGLAVSDLPFNGFALLDMFVKKSAKSITLFLEPLPFFFEGL